MAKGVINLQKESGGVTKITSTDGTGNTELVLPESGELATKEYVDDLKTIASGTATFNSTTNNINLTGIGVKVEIGDVIQISGATDSKNNNEFTVEVITDNNNIIVNQAHANKGTSKNVANRSSNTGVTVKLLAKWYNAPLGLGQDWVDVKNSRTYLTSYSNNTNRTIKVHISPETAGNTAWGIALNQNSLIISQAGGYTSMQDRMSSCNGEIVAGSNYRCTILLNPGFTAFKQWMELR